MASFHFLRPSSIIVFLTEAAQHHVFPQFRSSLPPELSVLPVPVPLGANEQELWRIFDCVGNAVQPGEEVAFDITHGLRSFPLVGLLAAAFLRSGLNVSNAVLYGEDEIRAR